MKARGVETNIKSVHFIYILQYYGVCFVNGEPKAFWKCLITVLLCSGSLQNLFSFTVTESNMLLTTLKLVKKKIDLWYLLAEMDFWPDLVFFAECRQRSSWGPGQCFAPQMGSSVCEYQCGSWQGLGRGMGRLQWHMLQFKLSLDPCSRRGPAGAQGGIHYKQTQAGLVGDTARKLFRNDQLKQKTFNSSAWRVIILLICTYSAKIINKLI